MKLRSLASGSSGNCVYIQGRTTRLLVDAGYSGRKIETLMKQAEVDPKRIDAILVTHEHIDHIAGVGVLSRRYHIPIYANRATWEAMSRKVGRIPDEHRKIFRNAEPFTIREIQVLPVPVHHDAADPVGYTFTAGSEKICVVTDTGFVDEPLLEQMSGADIYYFEANYEDLLLQNGSYSYWSKKRISSEIGHLSNHQSAEALCRLLEGRGEQVVLAHMSINNNTTRCCYQSVSEYLEAQGFTMGKGVHVLVAPREAPSPLFDAAEIRARGAASEAAVFCC